MNPKINLTFFDTKKKQEQHLQNPHTNIYKTFYSKKV